MLEELFAIFTFLKNLAFYTILISYNTGQLLVWCIQTCVNILLVLWGSMCTLGVVAGEDLDVWLNDVSARLGTATLWLVQAGERFGSTISDGLSLLISTGQIFTVVQNVILHVFSKIFSCILNIASWVKHICVLLGWGIWFAVTFVPLTIMYICINTTYCVGRFIEELLQVTCSLFTNILIMMHNAYEFIIDVPVESTIGLFIGACFIYVLLQSYQILYILLEHVATRIWRSFKLRCQRFYRRRSSHTINCKDSPDRNGRCVICMERGKCMLTMPCRHLCMCAECWDTLNCYQSAEIAPVRTCPVCRSCVEYTIHVY